MKVFTSLLALSLATAAIAQNVGPAFDKNVSNVLILQAASVRKEVGITDAQRTKLNAIASAFNAQKSSLTAAEVAKQKAQGANYKEDDTPLRALFGKMRNQALAVLTTPQIKRLRELTLQDVGMAAILDPVVAQAMGVTSAQTTKLKAAFVEGRDATEKVMEQASAPIEQSFRGKQHNAANDKAYDQQMTAAARKVSPQMEKIKAKTRAAFNAILTANQKKMWTNLLGKPFKG